MKKNKVEFKDAPQLNWCATWLGKPPENSNSAHKSGTRPAFMCGIGILLLSQVACAVKLRTNSTEEVVKIRQNWYSDNNYVNIWCRHHKKIKKTTWKLIEKQTLYVCVYVYINGLDNRVIPIFHVPPLLCILLYKLLFSRGFYFRKFRESNPRENFHFYLCLFIVMTTSAKSRN